MGIKKKVQEVMQIMQETRSECFAIRRDSNLVLRALGPLQDVSAAGAEMGEFCVAVALATLPLMQTLCCACCRLPVNCRQRFQSLLGF